MFEKPFFVVDLKDMSATEAAKNKAAYTREGRRQLFAVLQGARGSTGKHMDVSSLSFAVLIRIQNSRINPLVEIAESSLLCFTSSLQVRILYKIRLYLSLY